MSLKEEYISGVAVLSLTNHLLVRDEDLLRRVDELLTEGRRHFVIDLANVEKADSMGVGLLIGAYSNTSRQGGRLVFANAPKIVLSLLQITRLNRAFSIYGSVGEAVQSFHFE